MNTKKLLEWYKQHKRNLPFRNTNDPYTIWISEIIFQQTRIEQGLPYYYKFIKEFPDIFSLAQASEDKVLKLWQGLGYYSRARNMHHTAQTIVNNYDGKFPQTKKELLQLKGIGDYTAAAIASLAFGEPVGAVDGNVSRFLTRFFGLDIPIDSYQGKKQLTMLANRFIDKKQPGISNQAMIELGALVCKPKNPDCQNCPLQNKCTAYATGTIENLPVKKNKTIVKTRFLNYFLVRYKDEIIIEKRTQKGIWQNLYQLPLIETHKEIHKATDIFYKKLSEKYQIEINELIFIEKNIHQLTHQKLIIIFWLIRTSTRNNKFIHLNKLKNKAFPIIISKFLDNNL